MTPNLRIWKATKRIGLVIFCLLTLAWLASGWWGAVVITPHIYFSVESGCLMASWSPQKSIYAMYMCRHLDLTTGTPDYRMLFEARWDTIPGIFSKLQVPLWIPVGLTLVFTALASWPEITARRRARVGVCPRCSYSRTGLKSDAQCPECGAAAPAALPRS